MPNYKNTVNVNLTLRLSSFINYLIITRIKTVLFRLNDPQFYRWVIGYTLISLYRKFNNLEVDPIRGKNYDLTWQ